MAGLHRLLPFVAPCLLAMLAGCYDDSIGCLHDNQCGPGAYCKATQCVEPGADGGLFEVYRERVVPLIESGCNCHGPASDRPWRFDHTTEASTVASRADLRNWMYNPGANWRANQPDGEPLPEMPDSTVDRPAIIGYAVGQCGFRHPAIWAPDAPQSAELARWIERAYDKIERPPPLAEPPLPLTPFGAAVEAIVINALPLPEQTLHDRATDATVPAPDAYEPIAGYTVADGELAARLRGQCGCCHVHPRGFALPRTDPQAGPVAHGEAAFCAAQVWLPDGLGTYGLGNAGDPMYQRLHPIVYDGPDDPRLVLLARWFHFIKQTRPDTDARPNPDPCKPQDVGPDRGPDADVGLDGDVGPVDPRQQTLDLYMGSVGQLLETKCGNGGCHPAGSPSLAHPYPFADEAEAEEYLRLMLDRGLLDRAQPRNSTLIRVGVHEASHRTGPVPQPFTAADIEALVQWIEAIPADF